MEFEDDFEEFDTITMTDEDGEEVEFAVIDKTEKDGIKYLLVVEVELMDDEESEAAILRQDDDNDEETTYTIVDGDEFDIIADIFANNDGDYDVEIED